MNKTAEKPHARYERLIATAKNLPPLPTAVAHPCDEGSLGSVVEAARLGLIEPILVGPEARIRSVAAAAAIGSRTARRATWSTSRSSWRSRDGSADACSIR